MIALSFWSIPLLICTCAVRCIQWLFGIRCQHHIQGFVAPGFEAVEKAFRKNFHRNLESGGAAFTVYYNEELAVNLWGGYADLKSKKLWAEDTLTIGFSTTKIACSICIALLVDKDLVNYNDLVTKYWPEFGKNGKENITVRMLISHQAGLAILDEKITYSLIKDWRHMSRVLENQRPNWLLDAKKMGYHAITYGFLVDQLIRRVDPKHRSVGQFFREELSVPYGLEFYIGLPEELECRVARLNAPSLYQFLVDLTNLKFLRAVFRMVTNPYRSLLKRSLRNPQWMRIDEKGDCAYNDPQLHFLEIGSAVGIGTAKALAKMMILLNASVDPLLSPELFNQIRVPLLEETRDIVLGINMTCGHGFMHTKNQDGNYVVGHTGFGGQNVRLDPQYNLSMAYLHNGLTSDSGQFSLTFEMLERAVYKCVLR